jgi:DNA modification methylase
MQIDLISKGILDVRKQNRLNSPKKYGSSDIDSLDYLEELGVQIYTKKQPIKFAENINEHIHRWAPYVQGFSASFVQSQIDLYSNVYKDPIILDPFSGCGTVLVQAKLNGFRSYGIELNPLLYFIANAKLNNWDISSQYLKKIYNSISKDRRSPAPGFLKSDKQFNKKVLYNLELLKGGIEQLPENTEKQKKVKELIKVAFSSILIDCSNLKRSPCLGYSNKRVYDNAPFVLLDQKISQIAFDLDLIHSNYNDVINTKSIVYLANSMFFDHEHNFDLVITSPPYMNGLDYVINYKIEMGWLGFAEKQDQLKHLKNNMVVCDNVSKGLIKKFSLDNEKYTNEWRDRIKSNIVKGIKRRGNYRRMDMPNIVHKYFDDMFKVMSKVYSSMNDNGRFILVVGDSLIADVYVPTDLLIAKIGQDIGLHIEKIEKARERRSGQIRSYKLRESIITLKKKQL